MTTNLYNRIKLLPQVIQDLISEYNVDHRKQMQRLHKEYFAVIYYNCKMCTSPFPKDRFCSIDYFINSTCKIKCYWCSPDCFEDDTNEELKTAYITSVDEYLFTKTLQFPRQHITLDN